ncbi:GNAT family N-acetyltransferase [Testudinibacter sp. P80/BLE/0925]|uniref:GNAT family N-acetyltransferase n=1 Tax=Testudinibacter sp. TW-1 TaxID=3417757 RepID=UPI003D363F12
MLKATIEVNQELRLQQLTESDAHWVFQAIAQNRTYLGRWLPFIASTQQVSDSLEFIQSLQQNRLAQVFKIHYQGQGCGLIGFNSADSSNAKAEIGYWLCEDFQHKGIMTLATEALLDYGFRELGFNRIQIKCALGNHASRGIPQRLGLILEDIERQGILLSSGEFADFEIYSMLKQEWKK